MQEPKREQLAGFARKKWNSESNLTSAFELLQVIVAENNESRFKGKVGWYCAFVNPRTESCELTLINIMSLF